MNITKVISLFIRVFIVVFVFIMDVKVKAEPVLNIQKMNLDSDSLTSKRSDGSLDFFRGRGFFMVHQNLAPLIIHTPQGVVSSKDGIFLLEVIDGKTILSVLSGEALLSDRASGQDFKIAGGYSFWLGGLLAWGAHFHPLDTEAYNSDHVMAFVKNLSGWSEKEFDAQAAGFEPLRKKAVVQVAEKIQSSIDRDIKIIDEIVKEEEKKDNQKRLEQARVHKLFRERALGVPDENTESSRAPAQFSGEGDP